VEITVAEILARYWPILSGSLIGVAVLIASYRLANRDSNGRRVSIAEWLLVLPLVLRKQKQMDPTRGDRVLTKREVLGWAIVFVLAIVGIVFFGE
jgi:hypothetical protein